MHEIYHNERGGIEGLPSVGRQRYLRRQQVALSLVGRFVETHTDQIQDAIGGRPVDLDNLRDALTPLASVIRNSRVKKRDFERRVRQILEASPNQGTPDLPGIMAARFTEQIWLEIAIIRVARLAIRQGYVPGR